jgi:hypothetical protein
VVAAASARALASYVRRDPRLRAAFIAAEGLTGVRELLDSPSDRVLFPTLEILCALAEARDPDAVDSMCLLGVLPAALRYSGPAFPPELRLQAARLAEALTLSTQRGMHLLVACQGIPFFVGMIDDAPQVSSMSCAALCLTLQYSQHRNQHPFVCPLYHRVPFNWSFSASPSLAAGRCSSKVKPGGGSLKPTSTCGSWPTTACPSNWCEPCPGY